MVVLFTWSLATTCVAMLMFQIEMVQYLFDHMLNRTKALGKEDLVCIFQVLRIQAKSRLNQIQTSNLIYLTHNVIIPSLDFLPSELSFYF